MHASLVFAYIGDKGFVFLSGLLHAYLALANSVSHLQPCSVPHGHPLPVFHISGKIRDPGIYTRPRRCHSQGLLRLNRRHDLLRRADFNFLDVRVLLETHAPLVDDEFGLLRIGRHIELCAQDLQFCSLGAYQEGFARRLRFNLRRQMALRQMQDLLRLLRNRQRRLPKEGHGRPIGKCQGGPGIRRHDLQGSTRQCLSLLEQAFDLATSTGPLDISVELRKAGNLGFPFQDPKDAIYTQQDDDRSSNCQQRFGE